MTLVEKETEKISLNNMLVQRHPYPLFDSPLVNLPNEIILEDHLGGFDRNKHNDILDKLNNYSQHNDVKTTVYHHEVLEPDIKNRYKNLNFILNFEEAKKYVWDPLAKYTQHPPNNIKNFICSFNGSPHVSRQFLVAILKKFECFNSNYCSKNFLFSTDQLDGHIVEYTQDQNSFYRKFFISDDSEFFFNTIYSFVYDRVDHGKNIYNLESKLTESFIQIVSECLATSHSPFISEKFLYSIVTRGLFLTYGQPGWHDHLEKYYGFKKFNKLFDYHFDTIQNPVERLVELMAMILKFKVLTNAELYDLYLLEQDTIEFNYNHFFSGDYLKALEKSNNVS